MIYYTVRDPEADLQDFDSVSLELIWSVALVSGGRSWSWVVLKWSKEPDAESKHGFVAGRERSDRVTHARSLSISVYR